MVAEALPMHRWSGKCLWLLVDCWRMIEYLGLLMVDKWTADILHMLWGSRWTAKNRTRWRCNRRQWPIEDSRMYGRLVKNKVARAREFRRREEAGTLRTRR